MSLNPEQEKGLFRIQEGKIVKNTIPLRRDLPDASPITPTIRRNVFDLIRRNRLARESFIALTMGQPGSRAGIFASGILTPAQMVETYATAAAGKGKNGMIPSDIGVLKAANRIVLEVKTPEISAVGIVADEKPANPPTLIVEPLTETSTPTVMHVSTRRLPRLKYRGLIYEYDGKGFTVTEDKRPTNNVLKRPFIYSLELGITRCMNRVAEFFRNLIPRYTS